jgi:DNA polymerase-3 subunit delta'
VTDITDGRVPLPRENPDLLGHEVAERQFISAWKSGRLPHGWLITGPPGIGKATLAYRMARFVLAGGAGAADDGPGLFGDAPPAAETLQMEPENPIFRRVASSGHADLMSLERSFASDKDIESDPRDRERNSVIRVDDVRKAGGFIRMTPAEGGWRVVVVDAADEMNQNAANALLKMLEEPPNKALYFLLIMLPADCCRRSVRAAAGCGWMRCPMTR